MRRRSFRKPAVPISLFPFLAVLICTMGALIVLLVTVVQQARVYANNVTQQHTDEREREEPTDQAETEEDFREFVWRREVLEEQRSELTGGLADRRLQLSHLEAHIRRLEQEWKQLQQQVAKLESLGSAQSQDLVTTRKELDRMRAAIEQSRQELDEAKRQLAQRPRSYAVIPYEGPNGTRRRPIYIECTQTGIVVQPEGVVLNADDFDGPLGPGNPLDASLRTVREYLARTGQTEHVGEPYPLLLVRPDGSVAYGVARAAMKSWEDEFGYELVEGNVELKYPTPDPTLREELKRAVRDARQRQSLLAASMPSQFRGESLGGFVATPTHGGFVPVGNTGGRGTGDERMGRGFAPARVANSGQNPGSSAPRGNSRTAETTETRANQVSTTGTSVTRTGTMANGMTEMGMAGSAVPGADQAADGAAAAGTKGNIGLSSGEEGAAERRPGPLAASRGGNWALPKATANATGITRPIQVACLRDQLVVLPERGDMRPPRVVPAPAALADVMDEFVSAIWQHMEHWGIAVAGGYWKPVLLVEVVAGAESRFEELESLLESSGIEIKRKER